MAAPLGCATLPFYRDGNASPLLDGRPRGGTDVAGTAPGSERSWRQEDYPPWRVLVARMRRCCHFRPGGGAGSGPAGRRWRRLDRHLDRQPAAGVGRRFLRAGRHPARAAGPDPAPDRAGQPGRRPGPRRDLQRIWRPSAGDRERACGARRRRRRDRARLRPAPDLRRQPIRHDPARRADDQRPGGPHRRTPRQRRRQPVPARDHADHDVAQRGRADGLHLRARRFRGRHRVRARADDNVADFPQRDHGRRRARRAGDRDVRRFDHRRRHLNARRQSPLARLLGRTAA